MTFEVKDPAKWKAGRQVGGMGCKVHQTQGPKLQKAQGRNIPGVLRSDKEDFVTDVSDQVGK